LIVEHFNELSTIELYEILKTRFEIFVTLEHGKDIGGMILHEGVRVVT